MSVQVQQAPRRVVASVNSAAVSAGPSQTHISGGAQPHVAVTTTAFHVTARNTSARLEAGAKPAQIATIGLQGPQGIQGIAGPQGTQGIQGPVGVDGDKHYAFSQGSPSAFWTVAHNLGKYPSVTVIDSAGTTVVGSVTHLDANSLTVAFSAPFSGTAHCN